MRIRETLIGEAAFGEDEEEAHVELILGPKGGAVDYAFTNALSNPREGHVALLAVMKPNILPKPCTLLVNKVTIKKDNQAKLVFGPVQAAVAKAVIDSVEEGTIPKDETEKLLVITSIFVHLSANDKLKLFENNYKATKLALKRAIERKPSIDDTLSKKELIKHPLV